MLSKQLNYFSCKKNVFPASKIQKFQLKKKKWLLLIGFNPDQLCHFIDFSKRTKTHSLRVAFVTRNAPSFQQPVLYPRFFFFFLTHPRPVTNSRSPRKCKSLSNKIFIFFGFSLKAKKTKIERVYLIWMQISNKDQLP